MREGYSFSIQKLRDVYDELEPLFREHYAEMRQRLAGQGIEISPYKPRLDQYYVASDGGWLLTFVLRFDGKPCGYSQIYLTNDMHNGDYIAQEDTIFVTKAHRNGVGRKLARFVLDHLKSLGAKRLCVTAATDVRATILWKRMGFKEAAVQMIYTL